MEMTNMTTWLAPMSGGVQGATGNTSVFVAPQVILNAASNLPTLFVEGSNAFIDLYGTVISTFSAGLEIGLNATSTGLTLSIHQGAFVRGLGTSTNGVEMNGTGTVANQGDIYGTRFGMFVQFSGATSAVSVTNAGAIVGASIGINILDDATSTFTLVNTGTIGGSAFSFLGDDGVDLVTNFGTMNGAVNLNTNNDFYNGSGGRVIGTVSGSSGFDTLIGGAFSDRLDGGLDNDTLYGNAAADTLLGDAGNDTLFGGLGNDSLTGGLNNDFFVFNTALNASTNKDTITDFSHVDDTIKLENAIFTKLGAGVHALSAAFFRIGTHALDANDYIIYNSATGALSYDNDGNGAHAAIQFASLTGHPAIAYNDFLVI
jgi:Ca2+-binding RTX toxin-like protein